MNHKDKLIKAIVAYEESERKTFTAKTAWDAATRDENDAGHHLVKEIKACGGKTSLRGTRLYSLGDDDSLIVQNLDAEILNDA